MACIDCKHPVHEQYKNYPGHWYCFCPGNTMGRTICHTNAEDYKDIEKHKQALSQAKTPRWCPKEKIKTK